MEIIAQMLEIANNFTGDCGNRIASSKLKMVFKGFFPYAKCRLLKWRERLGIGEV
ncbi:MAG: hypothetical protein WAZ77_13010 [Candidatus Nitrosopolaris sp.]|jgi:hypothetical protein